MDKKDPTKIYYQIIFALIFVLLFLFGYKLSLYIFPKNLQNSQNLNLNLNLDSQLLFNTPDDKFCLQNSASCQQVVSFYNQSTKQNQNLNITLELPKPIIIGKKFNAKVIIKNTTQKISKVKLNFEGVEMNMGENNFDLSATKNNEFQGEIIIPMCVTGKMLWRVSAEIIFENQQKGVVNWLFEA